MKKGAINEEGAFQPKVEKIPFSSILLTYRGAITFEVVDALLSIALHRLELIEQNVTVRKKVYSILMECAQNLCLHVDVYTGASSIDTSSVYLNVESDDNCYYITSANFVQNLKLNTLTDLLQDIEGRKTIDDLRKLYNEIITNKHYSSKGGGGLGFIDMAIKSNGGLTYSFDKINDDYSFFTLNIKIKRS
jgi:hypothetical protein